MLFHQTLISTPGFLLTGVIHKNEGALGRELRHDVGHFRGGCIGRRKRTTNQRTNRFRAGVYTASARGRIANDITTKRSATNACAAVSRAASPNAAKADSDTFNSCATRTAKLDDNIFHRKPLFFLA